MSAKIYTCGYKHCLHPGEKMTEEEFVRVGRSKYHMDCAMTKQAIDEIRDTYAKRIDRNVNYPQLMKVLNDLVFKYGMDVDFVAYAVNYYADYGYKLKSPFVLLNLRKNNLMHEKWEKAVTSSASRERTNRES